MSVDILHPKVTEGPVFQYPQFSGMKEKRAPAVAPLKRRDSRGVNISNFDPNCIIYNPNTDTTYLRGKLLGKVWLFILLLFYFLFRKSPAPVQRYLYNSIMIWDHCMAP